MTKLEIKIPIHTYDKEGKEAEYIKSKLANLKFNWIFYGESTTFASNVRITKKKGNKYKHTLFGIKKLLEIVPQNKKLMEEHNKYVKMDATDYIYNVELVFEGKIEAEVDVENNSILFFKGCRFNL